MVSQVKLYLVDGQLSLLTTVNGTNSQRTDMDESMISEIIDFLSSVDDAPKSLTLQRYGNESCLLVDRQ